MFSNEKHTSSAMITRSSTVSSTSPSVSSDTVLPCLSFPWLGFMHIVLGFATVFLSEDFFLSTPAFRQLEILGLTSRRLDVVALFLFSHRMLEPGASSKQLAFWRFSSPPDSLAILLTFFCWSCNDNRSSLFPGPSWPPPFSIHIGNCRFPLTSIVTQYFSVPPKFEL